MAGTGTCAGVRVAAESEGCEVVCCVVFGALLRWIIAVCHFLLVL